MLHGGVDRRDVLEAVELAVNCKQTFGAYHIVREDLLSDNDRRAYPDSSIEVLDKVYPGAKEIIENYRLSLPDKWEAPDLSKEKAELGYYPKYNFGTFIKECTNEGLIRDALS
ncbi:hypothetical protein [Cohnella silvisoli]|uniref:NAD(P)-dependent oxidoreductase n=1 Tax=Cohnella silvisoli TaxID=2873699 RepID=A0ABV1L0R9_9BACL|nr:hypothetical protein [Cohnella silvisoli]MCD9025321.1 hypothetical protein [Cohnella silvisoli]